MNTHGEYYALQKALTAIESLTGGGSFVDGTNAAADVIREHMNGVTLAKLPPLQAVRVNGARKQWA